MRLLVGFEKGEQARYLSHLDIQRALQRTLRRAGLPVMYSAGFNPHPLISYASALAVGVTSSLEVFELQTQDIGESAALEALREHAAPGITCVRVRAVSAQFPQLTPLAQAAAYTLSLISDLPSELLAQRVSSFLAQPIMVQKKGKAGIKTIDLLPFLYEFSVLENDSGVSLTVTGAHTQAGSLPIVLLANALTDAVDRDSLCRIHRLALLTKQKNGSWINILDFVI